MTLWQDTEQLSLLEDFVLAPDRQLVLEKHFVAGSPQATFLSGLHQLHCNDIEGAKEAAGELTDNWGVQRDLRRELELLISLHKWGGGEASKRQTLTFLSNQLGLDFSAQQDAVARAELGSAAAKPTTVEEPDTSLDKFLDWQLKCSGNVVLEGDFSDAALLALYLRRGADDVVKHRVVQCISCPAILPQLPQFLGRVVQSSAKAARQQAYGSDWLGDIITPKLLQSLTLQQLHELRQHCSMVASSQLWMAAAARKMHPHSPPERLSTIQKASFLEEMDAFAAMLPQEGNWLRVRILHARLKLQQETGEVQSNVLVEFLKLIGYVQHLGISFLPHDKGNTYQRNAFQSGGPPTGPLLPELPYQDAIHTLVRACLQSCTSQCPARQLKALRKCWAGLLEEKFEQNAVAEAVLLSGGEDAATWGKQYAASWGDLRQLQERVELEFAASNRRRYQAADDVVLQLDVKNVPLLLVKVFEINLWNFYRSTQKEVGTDIELEGLGPTTELTFEFQEPPMRRMRRDIALPSLTGLRGACIVEAMGAGKTSRALLLKGRLHHIERISSAGHAFTLLSEDCSVVQRGRVWVNGQEYLVDTTTGEAVVPFRPSERRGAVLVLGSDDGAAALVKFDHLAEDFTLQAGMYMDREMLQPREDAPLLVRAALLLHSHPAPLQLLQDVKLTIHATDIDGVESQQVTPDFKLLPDQQVTAHQVAIPERCGQLRAVLSGRVRLTLPGPDSQPQYQDLSHTSSWDVLGDPAACQGDASRGTKDVHLARLFSGCYALKVLGRCGEPAPAALVQVSLTSPLTSQPLHFQLQSDEEGSIGLGRLVGISKVAASLPLQSDGVPNIERSWNLVPSGTVMHDTWQAHRSLHVECGPQSEVRVPYSGGAGELELGKIQLLKVGGDGQEAIADMSSHVGREVGYLCLRGLPEGLYKLHLLEGMEVVEVSAVAARATLKRASSAFILSQHQTLSSHQAHPLQVVGVNVSASSGISVSLAGSGAEVAGTRVITALTRFLPPHTHLPLQAAVAGGCAAAPAVAMPVPVRDNEFVSGRALAEETRYVLERRQLAKQGKLRAGNLLEKPSLLVHRWARGQTSSTNREAKLGQAFDECAKPAYASRSAAKLMKKRMASPPAAAQGPPCTAFCTASFLLPNLQVYIVGASAGEDGKINITPQQLQRMGIDLATSGHTYIQVVAAAPSGSVAFGSAHVEAGPAPPPLRDMGLLRVSAGGGRCTEARAVAALLPGAALAVSDISSAKLAMYDSVPSVAALFGTLLGLASRAGSAGQWAEFSFLGRWGSLGAAEKLDALRRHACHELHFFLYHRDRPIFDSRVKPMLQNKMASELEFMDCWLLGTANLVQRWGAPHRFALLNSAEQCLLAAAAGPAMAGRFAADMRARCRQALKQRWAADMARQRFDAALSTADLDAEGGGGGGLGRQMAAAAEKELFDMMSQPVGGAPVMPRPPPAPMAFASFAAPGGPAGGAAFGAAPSPAVARGAAMPCAEPQPYGAHQDGGFQNDDEAWEVVDSDADEGVTELSSDASTDLGPGGWEDDDLQKRRQQQELPVYQVPKQTQEWAEGGYWRFQQQSGKDLIGENHFWADYAEFLAGGGHGPGAEGAQPALFLSTHLAHTTNSFTEAVFALAVLGVPLEAPSAAHETIYAGLRMTLHAASPAIVFHRQIQAATDDAAPAALGSSVMVVARLFEAADRFTEDETTGDTMTKVVSGVLTAGKAYGYQILVTSMSEAPQALNILVQVPQGALPLQTRPFTWTTHDTLQPYASKTLEMFFYFPHEGSFEQLPVCVSKGGALVGCSAAAPPLRVMRRAPGAALQGFSWPHLAQRAPSQEVLDHLREGDLTRATLADLRWRCQDRTFFLAATQALRSRLVYDDSIWQYAVLHGEEAALNEFLSVSEHIRLTLGPVAETPLLRVEPAEKGFRHLEYWPLVNPRAHQLGGQHHILDESLKQQWGALLSISARRPTLLPEDALQAAYFLLAQDRVEEAEALLQRFEADLAASSMRLQLDYLRAWLSLQDTAVTRQQLDFARGVVSRYAVCADVHWAQRIRQLDTMLRELQHAADTPGTRSTAQQAVVSPADKLPELSLEDGPSSHQITLLHSNIVQVQVSAYEMDVELLFSSHPFGQAGGHRASTAGGRAQQLGHFSFVKPRASTSLVFAPGTSETVIDLRSALPGIGSSSSVLIDISGGGLTCTRAQYADGLAVRTIQQLGILHAATVATDDAPSKPVPAAYVKVFAKVDGKPKPLFHKDGYTDLRGRFDYASLTLSGSENARITLLAVLVITATHGAVIKEVAPPPSNHI